MTYEKLKSIAEKENIEIIENCNIGKLKGLYIDNIISLSKSINNQHEKKCIVAEELGHHYTSYGNILDQDNIKNIKQEKIARRWAYKKLVTFKGIIEAYENGVKNRYELASYLKVTEKFLIDAVKYYKSKYGIYYIINNYIIYFEPLGILERR